MKIYIAVIIILLVAIQLWAGKENTTFRLKTGETIMGTVVKVDDKTGVMDVKTIYGFVKIDPKDLILEVVKLNLNSGEVIKGQIIEESDSVVRIQSVMGIISISKNDISRIDYGDQTVRGMVKENPKKFTMGTEKQVDVFYDATAYTLEKGIVYVSGLSWGFGVTPRLQIMSRYSDYVWGNFNVKPKFQVFQSGNWEKEQALAIGFSFNTRYRSTFYKWYEENYNVDNRHYDYSTDTWIESGNTTNVYYGEYIPIGSKPALSDDAYYDDKNNHVSAWVDLNDPDFQNYYEVFAAYTLSQARAGTSGRINHTIGARVGKLAEADDLIYRVYYAGGVDIRKNLILNYELFYDPFYIEWWNRGEQFYYDEELSTSIQNEPDVSPLHFDIGFIYTHNDWLSLGIHFQPYIFAIYMKF